MTLEIVYISQVLAVQSFVLVSRLFLDVMHDLNFYSEISYVNSQAVEKLFLKN